MQYKKTKERTIENQRIILDPFDFPFLNNYIEILTTVKHVRETANEDLIGWIEYNSHPIEVYYHKHPKYWLAKQRKKFYHD